MTGVWVAFVLTQLTVLIITIWALRFKKEEVVIKKVLENKAPNLAENNKV